MLNSLLHVVIVEASGHLLGAFQTSLVKYVESLFIHRRFQIKTDTAVKSIIDNKAMLSNGEILEFGLMIWSAGIKQVSFIRDLPVDEFSKAGNGRLMIDSHLHVLGSEGNHSVYGGSVFAMGDCAGDVDKPLPALAQVYTYMYIFANLIEICTNAITCYLFR